MGQGLEICLKPSRNIGLLVYTSDDHILEQWMPDVVTYNLQVSKA